jgi:hypothetical protein
MTDLSKYKAFPRDYVIRENTKVICLVNVLGLQGLEGIATESSIIPFCSFKCGTHKTALHSHQLAPLNPQDHPDFKQEEPEWQPKTGEVVNVFPNEELRRIFLFKDNIGYWCVMGGLEDLYRKGEKFEIFCQKEVWQVKPEPIKLTRAEIAEKFGTDNFEIID